MSIFSRRPRLVVEVKRLAGASGLVFEDVNLSGDPEDVLGALGALIRKVRPGEITDIRVSGDVSGVVQAAELLGKVVQP